MSQKKFRANDHDLVLTFLFDAATAVDRDAFVANRPYQLRSVERSFGTASASGQLDLKKCTGTTAPASGTSMLNGALALTGTANSVSAATLSGTASSLLLADGDRIGFDFVGTVTNLVGLAVTVVLRPTDIR